MQKIERYSKLEVEIVEFKNKYENVVYDISTTSGMKDAKDARKMMRDLRSSIEQVRKEEKEESLIYGRKVDAEAARIKLIIEPIEGRIDAQIKIEEKRKEDEKLAKIEVEREKLRALEAEALAEERRVQELKFAEAKRIADLETKRQEEEAAKLRIEREAFELEKKKLEDEKSKLILEQQQAEREKRAEVERKELAERQEKEKVELAKKIELQKAEEALRKIEDEKKQADIAEKRKQEAIEVEKDRVRLMKQNGYKILTEFCSKYVNDKDFSTVVVDINKFLASKK